jgi:cytochrome c oxidase subunit 2
MIYDIARQWQWNFQDPASPLMEGLIDLHHNILFVLILIFGVVTSLIISILKDTSYIWIKPNKINIIRQKQYLLFSNINHGTVLEIVWTLIPSFILFAIAIPSFALLYSMEEILDPQMTIKVIANQWYWTFEYGNLGLEWDSYMINESDLVDGEPRLLTVDNPLFIPIETNVRLLITSKDVIHAFAVPSLGLKVDAVPGRLNQLSCYINRPGIYYGQCSELCGVNHGFMPLQIVSFKFDA